MTDHLFVPDTQVRDGVNTDHIKRAGLLALDRKPDVIVFAGDHWDFPSLSTHTPQQKIAYEQLSYNKDFKAGVRAMELFLKPIEEYNKLRRKNKKKPYKPTLVYTMGNHEYRVERLLEQQPVLRGLLPSVEAYLADKGFQVIPFKQPAVIDGVTYCHYCPQTNGPGAINRAHLIMNRRHSSWTVGHKQDLDYFVSDHHPRVQCLIAGAFYTHDEGYKVGTNDHWRGLVYKRNVKGGTYDPEFISIEGLTAMYD